MTPFGERLRQMRQERGISQKEMAKALSVSPAYLSALEHGHRSPPSGSMIQKIIGYFNVIWDDGEELQRLAETSHPRVVVDTAGLPPQATELANLLALNIAKLRVNEIEMLLAHLQALIQRSER